MNWREYSQADIIPHAKRGLVSRLWKVHKDYSRGLTLKEEAHLLGLIGSAHILSNLNQSERVQRLRAKLGIPLPPVSGVTEIRGGKPELVEGTPWMMYLSKVEADIPLIFNQRFNFEHPDFLKDLIATLVSTGITANKASFNTLLHCVEDPHSQARIPFVDMPQLSDTEALNASSLMVIFPDDYVKVIQLNDINQIWQRVDRELDPLNEQNWYSSLEELIETKPDLPIQTVIDMAGYSQRLGVPPYRLWFSAHNGVAINTDDQDPNFQEMRFHSNHLATDGTLNNQLVLSVPMALDRKFNAGMLERPTLPFIGGSIEYITTPDEKRQAIGLNGLPDLPFSARVIAALSLQQRYHVDRTPPGRKPDKKDVVRRVSGTVAANHPEHMTGEKPHDYLVQQINRISVFQTDTVEHAPVLRALNDIRNYLKNTYGDTYLQELIQNGAQVCKALPLSLKATFGFEMKKSLKRIREKIDEARNNEGSIELSDVFYGKYMDQGIADPLERTMSPKVRAQVHGHMVVTNIDVDGIIEDDTILPRFDTIAPLAGEVPDQAVLATLNLKPITPRYYAVRSMLSRARQLAEQFPDNDEYREALEKVNLLPPEDLSLNTLRHVLQTGERLEVLGALTGYNNRIPDEIKRSASSHLFSLETATDNPVQEVTEYAAYLYDDWHLVHNLMNHVYRPWMRFGV